MLASIVLLVPTYGPRLADAFGVLKTRELTWRTPGLVGGRGRARADPRAALPRSADAPESRRGQVLRRERLRPGHVPGRRPHRDAHAAPACCCAGTRRRRTRKSSTGSSARRRLATTTTAPPRVAGVRCLPPNGGAADCAIEMDTVGVTRGTTFLDTSKPRQGQVGLPDRRDGQLAERRQRRRRDGRQPAGDRHSPR